MKLLVFIMLVLIGAVSLSLFVMDDPGYVLIAAGKWTFESSLALLCAVLLVVFVVLYYAIRFVSGLRRLPRGVHDWRQHRREDKAQTALAQGLVKLAEGDWKAAERKVVKFAETGPAPIVNYLTAARAAQELGAEARRDHYLKLAHEKQPDSAIAVGLTQVELQLSQNQKELALATLCRLKELAPKNPQVLKLLTQLYQELGDWQALTVLLPSLHKYANLPLAEFETIAGKAYVASIEGCKDFSALQTQWSQVPKAYQEKEAVLVAYLQQLMALGEDAPGEALLRHAIKRSPSARLVNIYGRLRGADPGRQLTFAEDLLRTNEQDAALLLTVGRLCLRNQLWGKARHFLEASVAAEPSVEAYNELAALLDNLGEKDLALQCYRNALHAVPGCEAPIAGQLQNALPGSTAPAAED